MNKFISRLSGTEKILFIKRLSILLKAGVPLLAALRMLRDQSVSQYAKAILDQIIPEIENGQSLFASLGRHGKMFGIFAIQIIRVGEISGTLYANLEYLADEMRKKEELRKKIVSAMVYPAFIIMATIVITALLTLYVFPKILPIFQSFHFQLPWTTKVIIGISHFVLTHSFVLFVGCIVLGIVGIVLFRIGQVKFFRDSMLLQIPVMGHLFQSYYLSSICRTLGLLLKSGMREVEAITVTASTSTNGPYRKELLLAAARVGKGDRISVQLQQSAALFPPMVVQMIMVGETTGSLSESFLYLAEIYEHEVEDLSKNLSGLIEPVLMVCMGMVVGFVAVSIITPIYQITQNLHP